MKKNYKMFFGTFGLGHKNYDRVQPIMAKSEKAAIIRMNELHGNRWLNFQIKILERFSERRIENDGWRNAWLD